MNIRFVAHLQQHHHQWQLATAATISTSKMRLSRATFAISTVFLVVVVVVVISDVSKCQDYNTEGELAVLPAAATTAAKAAASSLRRVLRQDQAMVGGGGGDASKQIKPYDLKGVEFESISLKSKNANNLTPSSLDEHQLPGSCQLVQIVHLLQHAGCQPKAIISFACSGSCSSYVQTSTSKFWQHERSCFCCQQTGSQEAIFTLDCPSQDPPFKKVKAFAPVNCMCRSCTDFGKEDLRPHELVEALAGEIDTRLQ